MKSDEVDAVPSVQYDLIFEDFGAPSNSEEWNQLREVLLGEWRYLYSQNLENMGFEDDGEFLDCADGAFNCALDYAGKELRTRWETTHRVGVRVIAVHGFSSEPYYDRRDKSRMRTWRNILPCEFGETRNALSWDVGHYIAHAIGGQIENNIFAQRSDVNRGNSEHAQKWRAMETYARKNPGTFMFARPVYGDGSDHPFFVELGLLRASEGWWIEMFPNRYTYTPFTGWETVPEWRNKLTERMRAGYKGVRPRMTSNAPKRRASTSMPSEIPTAAPL